MEGIDSTKYRDEAAEIGTLAHAMIQAHIQGELLDTSTFSQAQIDQAENAVLSYFEWERQHTVKPILVESPMVSDACGYGGTIDLYCKLDGVPTLVDFKTGKAIYDEYFVQLAAYVNLLRENGYAVDNVRILRIGRDETEGFEERVVADTSTYFKIFASLLTVYYAKKEVGWR